LQFSQRDRDAAKVYTKRFVANRLSCVVAKKGAAKRSAKKAGRHYPNLLDNRHAAMGLRD
jgi:hypothetical protein